MNLFPNHSLNDELIIVEAQNLEIGYEKKLELKQPINFSLKKGQSLALVGGNGSGKTTLLKTIADLIKPISGSLRLPIAGEISHSIAWLGQFHPQNPVLPIRVQDLVRLAFFPGRGLLNPIEKESKNIIEDSLDFVGMKSFAKKNIDELSGGQRQRVFLAYAIARRAPLILLDEPSQNLDKEGLSLLSKSLKNWREAKASIIIATHDVHELDDCDIIIEF